MAETVQLQGQNKARLGIVRLRGSEVVHLSCTLQQEY